MKIKELIEQLDKNKPTWAIVDEEGNKVVIGFRSRTCAQQNISRYRLNRNDKLKVIEE